MSKWMKILKELEPINQSQRLHEKLYTSLKKAKDFTPDKASEYEEDMKLLAKVMEAHIDFREHPPHMHEGFGDMFGKYLMETEQLSGRAGQFFTPMSVVKMMCKMTLEPTGLADEARYISDPAAGCGRFMIGTAEVYAEKLGYYNFLYQNIDIDKRMYVYCTMNAILYGIPSINLWGNSISLEMWEGIAVLPNPTIHWIFLDKEQAQGVLPKFEAAKRGLAKFIDEPVKTPVRPDRLKIEEEKPKQSTLL